MLTLLRFATSSVIFAIFVNTFYPSLFICTVLSIHFVTFSTIFLSWLFMWCPLPFFAFFGILFSNFLTLANRIDLLNETLGPGFPFAFLPGLHIVVTLHKRHSNVLMHRSISFDLSMLYGSKEVPGEIMQTEISEFYSRYFYERRTHLKQGINL